LYILYGFESVFLDLANFYTLFELIKIAAFSVGFSEENKLHCLKVKGLGVYVCVSAG
jgi:hypothetical protein